VPKNQGADGASGLSHGARDPVSAPTAEEFTVRIDAKIDYAASLEFFRRSGDDLLDRWDGRTLVRTIAVGTTPIAYACTFAAVEDALEMQVAVKDERYRDEIERIVRAMFVIPPPQFSDLISHDPIIAALDVRYPAVRSVRQSNLFGALLRCISTQQVNLRWAATCRSRLAETFGRPHQIGGTVVYSLDPARIATLKVSDIRGLQLTNSKSEYIINVARVIASGEVTIDLLDRMTGEEIITCLSAIRGIGVWSAEWILARTLGRPRVVAGDLGVRKAVGIAYCGGTRPIESEVRRVTAHWGESAAVAQALLLHALAEKTLSDIVANADGAATPSAAPEIPIRPKSARNSLFASPRKP
jgi:DNA-3-methyladenine glycosylase II